MSVTGKAETKQKVNAWCRIQGEVVEVEFDWFIERFSLKTGKKIGTHVYSSVFSDQSLEKNGWRLSISPSGCNQEHAGQVGLYLSCSPDRERMVISCKLTLMNSKQKIIKVIGPLVKEIISSCILDQKAVSLVELFKEENNFLPDDVLHIKCELIYEINVTAQSGSGSYSQPSLLLFDQSGTLTENFKELLGNHSLADLTINIQGQTFNAHKVILSARSPVFHAMFQTDLSEKKTNILEVRDIKPAVFKEVLRSIYTDEVEKLEEMAPQLLAAADKYMLPLLKSKCEAHLATKIAVKTCGMLLLFAHLHLASGLKEKVLDFVRCHSADVVKTTGWQELLQSADSNLLRDISVAIMTPRSQPIN